MADTSGDAYGGDVDDAEFSKAFEAFFGLLSARDFERASRAAHSMPCARPLSAALQHLVDCEALYLSMASFKSRRSPLERRLDTTARELEACLSQNHLDPPSIGHSISARFTPSWARRSSKDEVLSSGGAQSSTKTEPRTCLDTVGMFLTAAFTSLVTVTRRRHCLSTW